MKGGVGFVLGLVAGCAGGAAGTFFYMKKKQEAICEAYDETIQELLETMDKPDNDSNDTVEVPEVEEVVEEPVVAQKPKKVAKGKPAKKDPEPELEEVPENFELDPTSSLSGVTIIDRDGEGDKEVIRGTEIEYDPDAEDPDPEYLAQCFKASEPPPDLKSKWDPELLDYVEAHAIVHPSRAVNQMHEFGKDDSFSILLWHVFTDGIVCNECGEIMDEDECIEWMAEDYLEHFGDFGEDNAAYFVSEIHDCYIELDKEEMMFHEWHLQKYHYPERQSRDFNSN